MKVSLREKFKRFVWLLVDPERKSLIQIAYESLGIWLRDGRRFHDYYGALLFKRYSNILDGYIGARASTIRAQFNSTYWFPLLDNKLMFHLFFKDKPVRTAKLLGYSLGNQFFADNHHYQVSTMKEFDSFMEMLGATCDTGSVFVKSAGGIGGAGCWLYDKDAAEAERIKIYRSCLSPGCIFEETVQQHPNMSLLHPNSVNTLRIDAFRDSAGEVHVISALNRIGTGGAHVDNASSGGCFVGVDLASGTLKQYAYTLPKRGGKRLSRHPDTDIVFEGFSVPCFEQALQLVRTAAALVPDRLVGWDVAIAPDGPVLIEANPNYDTRVSEVAYGGYLRNPVYELVLSEYDSPSSILRMII